MLLEDVGALLGLGCALVGVSLTVVTGQSRFDAVDSIAIGLLLGVIAVVLGSEMRSLLIGEAASPAEVAAIRAALGDGLLVRRLIHLRTLQLGPDELLVGAKVELDPALSFPRSPGRSTRPSGACGPGCRPRGSSTWSRTATGPERSPGRSAAPDA